jgi:integrase
MSLKKRCECSNPKGCRHPYHYAFKLHERLYRGSTRTPNVTLARRILVARQAAALEGKEGLSKPSRGPLLSAFMKDYLAAVEEEHATYEKDERVLNDFKSFVGDRHLADVSQFVIEKWKIARAKTVAQSTVNRELNVIKGMFSRAVEWKQMAVSPAQGVRKFDVDDVRVRVLSSEEMALVLAEAPAHIALLCRVTLECLPRLSEVLGLRREHIGPSASWIELRRKGGRVERIPVAPELRDALLTGIHASGWVFGQGEDGEPPTQAAVSVEVGRLMKRLGLPGVSHHTMRHTGITLMLENGVNPRAIQKLAGWTSLRMLERYGHVRDAELQRAVRVVQTFTQLAEAQRGSQKGSHDGSGSSERSLQVADYKWRPQRDSNPCFGLERATS